jgi:hypothetical protein
MIRFVLMGAAILALVTPTSAREINHVRNATHGAVASHHVFDLDRNLPVEDALRLGYSQGYEHYPSGYGGLYGDGLYPGNVISNERQ